MAVDPEQPGVDHDRLFKELLRTFFADFLDLFLPAVAGYVEPGSVEFLDKELFTDVTSGERHEVDLLAKVRFRDEPAFFLIHVETQASARPEFAGRMFRYFARLTERHGLPVYPIALLTFDDPRRPEPDRFEVTFPDLDVLAFRFRTIQLNQFNWRDFVRQPNPVAAALMTKMRVAQADRPRVTLEILRLIVTLKLDPARQTLIRQFMGAYLRLSAEERRAYTRELETLDPPEREAVMQSIDMWDELGIAKGEARGEARGEAKARREILLLQLRRRFGPAAEPLAERVAALTPDKLTEMAGAIFDFGTPTDAEAWLAAHG